MESIARQSRAEKSGRAPLSGYDRSCGIDFRASLVETEPVSVNMAPTTRITKQIPASLSISLSLLKGSARRGSREDSSRRSSAVRSCRRARRLVSSSLVPLLLGFPPSPPPPSPAITGETDESAHEDSLHQSIDRDSSEREKASSLHPPSRISSTLAIGNSST